jgi:hypothetical protein
VDSHILDFYNSRRSKTIAITATQGIGKTSLLAAYDAALREKLAPQGFYVIRYMADPEVTFDRLIRALLEPLIENILMGVVQWAVGTSDQWQSEVRTSGFTNLMSHLCKNYQDSEEMDPLIARARQWLLGLPVRKEHRDALGVTFRLDTVELQTRVLRDLVNVAVAAKALQGIFLLLDEMEKIFGVTSQTRVVQYLMALRALIDALPTHLFVMLAVTPDALERYGEMVPAFRSRVAAEIVLPPLTKVSEGMQLREFYEKTAQETARRVARQEGWSGPGGDQPLVKPTRAAEIFESASGAPLRVRQRDFLSRLHEEARVIIDRPPGPVE